MSHHIVEVKELRHVYPDGTEALRGVSFRITHGESVAIIGANGAGKSTLLLHLNGYLTPTSGEIRIGDFPLTKSTLPEIRRTVGMVFQDPDDQLFMPTVFDDVAFGPLNLGLPPAEVQRRVSDALIRVEAEHLTDKPPYRLSGGEKKRVAIATVLSMAPDILVMDEPTAGLDPFARRHFMALLRDFRHTKIFTSHDLDMVMELCERTIILREGTVAADGPTWELFQDRELLATCRLEPPLALQGCPVCGRGAEGGLLRHNPAGGHRQIEELEVAEWSELQQHAALILEEEGAHTQGGRHAHELDHRHGHEHSHSHSHGDVTHIHDHTHIHEHPHPLDHQHSHDVGPHGDDHQHGASDHGSHSDDHPRQPHRHKH